MPHYRELKSIEEWQRALDESSQRTVLVFKHSTTCPISAAAWREFEAYLNAGSNAEIDYLMVKVIESRPVSTQIARDLDVRHASPQVILVRDQHAVWNTSHGRITSHTLRQAVG